MKSMTGYGRGEATNGQLGLTVELSGVNRKGLDVQINGLRDHPALEGAVIARLRQAVHRGSLTVHVQRSEHARDPEAETVEGLVVERIRRFEAISRRAEIGLRFDARWMDEAIRTALAATSGAREDGLGDLLTTALESALEAFEEMRRGEGSALRKDLGSRVRTLREAVGRVQEAASGTVKRYRDVLLGRLRDLDLDWDPTDERVLREVAIYADRIDIQEELTRLDSHLVQFEEGLGTSGPIGRKLDFIAQEINREVNTIGSKGNDLTVSREVISIKTELERIREQLANVE